MSRVVASPPFSLRPLVLGLPVLVACFAVDAEEAVELEAQQITAPRAVEQGNGPVDAIFNAIKALVPHEAMLELYQVHAVTEGTDAQATVSVRIEEDGRIATGSSADTDTIVASVKAYVNALNRLIIRRQKTAPGEDVKTVSYHGE